MDDIKVILVPLANPDTAVGLLRLAWAFAESEDCKIIALHVLQGDLDHVSESLDDLEPVIDKLQEEGAPIEFQSQNATNVARGILDTAGEFGADLIVLGVKKRVRGHIELGTVIENILTTASSKVVIYRQTHSDEPPARIVAPVDGTPQAKAAARMGALLAQYYRVEMTAIHAQTSDYPRWVGLGHIAESLEDVNNGVAVIRQLVTASDPASGILARLEDNDLLVLGYKPRSAFEQLLFGNFPRRMLDKAPCPTILISASHEVGLLESRIRRWLFRFHFRLTPDEQEDMQRLAYELSAVNLDFVVLIAIAATLASLGLLADNSTIIIGAMLVAPLMQPSIAIAIGIITRRIVIVRRGFGTLLAGIPVAILIAIICNILVHNVLPTTQMLALSRPTMLDTLIAFASGFMGAYATVRRDVSTVLAGVAIAVSLTPPLCALGLFLAIGRPEQAMGAGLTFLANVVCVVAAAWLVFVLVGMRPLPNDDD
jgi:uncharacterized hydrophobic protein (TIGR00271 family)